MEDAMDAFKPVTGVFTGKPERYGRQHGACKRRTMRRNVIQEFNNRRYLLQRIVSRRIAKSFGNVEITTTIQHRALRQVSPDNTLGVPRDAGYKLEA